MKKIIWNESILFVFILIMIAVAGCNADQTNTVPSSQPGPTKTILATSTPSPTETPTVTPLPTEIPEQEELLFTKTFPQLPQIIRSDDETLLFTHDGFTFQVLDGEDYSTLYQSELNSSGEGKIVQVSPDGSMVVLQDNDQTGLLSWDSGLSIPLGNHKDFGSVAFSENMDVVVFSSKPDCIQTLDIENQKISSCYPIDNNSKKGYFSPPAISPDGSMIAAGYMGSNENFTYIWDTQNNNILYSFQYNYRKINCLAFHPDGESLVSADTWGHLIIIDTNNGNVIKDHTSFDRDIQEIEYSEDGNIINLYLPLDQVMQFNLLNAEVKVKEINFNDPYSEKLLLEGYLYPHQLPALKFHPNGSELAISQGNIQIIDLDNQTISHSFFEDKAMPNANVSFSHDGKYLASISYFGDFHIWNLEINGWEQIIPNTIGNAIYSYNRENEYGQYKLLPGEFSPDNKEIAFLHGGKIEVWNIENWSMNEKHQRHSSGSLTDLSYSTDGNTIYAINGINQEARISSGSNGDLFYDVSLRSGNTVDFIPAAINKSLFGRVMEYDDNEIIEIVDLNTNALIQIPLPPEIESAAFIDFSPTGHLIYLINSLGKVFIWKTSTGDLLFASDIPMSTTKSAIRSDGQLFADISVEDHKSVLRVWSLADYIDESIFSEKIILPAQTIDEDIISPENVQNIKQIFSTGIGKINDVIWGNGNQLHVFTSQGYFRLNASTLEIDYADDNHEFEIIDGFVFADQRAFASANLSQGRMQIWDLDYKKRLVEFVGDDPVIMGPDHLSVLFMNGDYGLTQWDAITGDVRQNYKCSTDIFNNPTFSSNENYLAAVDSVHEVCIWNTSDAEIIDSLKDDVPFIQLQFSNSGEKLYAATKKYVLIRDIVSKTTLEKIQFDFPSDTSQITAMHVSPTEDTIALLIDDALWIYDLSADEVVSILQDESRIESFSYNPDGNKILTQNNDGVISIYDMNDFSILESKRVTIPKATKLIPLLDGTIAIQFSKEFIVYQPATGDIVSSGKIDTGRILDISPTGTQFFVSHNLSHDIVDIESNNIIYSIEDLSMKYDEATADLPEYKFGLNGFYNQDGTKIVVYTGEMLWTIDNEAKSVINILNLENINQAALSNNDRFIIVTQNGNSRILYDFQKEELIDAFTCYSCADDKYVFNPNNKWLVYADKSRWGPKIIRVKDSDESYRYSYFSLDDYNSINTLAFSPDGKLLVLGKETGAFEIVDTNLLESIHLISDQSSELTLAAFTSDGKYIVTASDKGSIHIWGIER
jgi:WD40 repeat protein